MYTNGNSKPSWFRIGLDIDGVLAEFSGHFLDYLGFEDKTPAKSWDDPRFRQNFHKIADDEEFWSTIPPIIHGSKLTFKPEIYVTARSIPTKVTKLWLYKHEFPPAPVVTVGVHGSKADSLRGRVELFLDDGLHNFEELNMEGINCWLVTRSHNEYYKTNYRVKDLKTFQEKYIKDGRLNSDLFSNVRLHGV